MNSARDRSTELFEPSRGGATATSLPDRGGRCDLHHPQRVILGRETLDLVGGEHALARDRLAEPPAGRPVVGEGVEGLAVVDGAAFDEKLAEADVLERVPARAARDLLHGVKPREKTYVSYQRGHVKP